MSIRPLIPALLAAALVFSAVGALAESQNWFLLNDGTAAREFLGGSEPTDTIGIGQSVVWLAPEALVAVDLSGTWGFSVKVNKLPGPNAQNPSQATEITVEVGKVDSTGDPGSFTSYGISGLLTVPASTFAPHVIVGSLTATGAEFAVDDHLAFRITNEGWGEGARKRITVEQNDASTFLTSPSSDPGYPTPELGTLLLAGAGIVGLAAVAYTRRGK